MGLMPRQIGSVDRGGRNTPQLNREVSFSLETNDEQETLEPTRALLEKLPGPLGVFVAEFARLDLQLGLKQKRIHLPDFVDIDYAESKFSREVRSPSPSQVDHMCAPTTRTVAHR